MSYEEALKILGPERHARIQEFVATAPPLTEAQMTLLVGLFNMPEDTQRDDRTDSDVA